MEGHRDTRTIQNTLSITHHPISPASTATSTISRSTTLTSTAILYDGLPAVNG